MLPITATIAISPILTVIPVLRTRLTTMNDPQEPHQRSRRLLGQILRAGRRECVANRVRVPLRALGEISIMTNSTRLIGIVMTAALWAGVAAAQGISGAGAGEDLPPDLTLPSQGAETLPSPLGQTTAAP